MTQNELPSDKKKPRIPFWKLGLGGILVLMGLMNFDPTGPPELRPTNSAQAIGYYGVTAVFIGAGLYLIAVGLRAMLKSRAQQ
jgi:hypothetical protein